MTTPGQPVPTDPTMPPSDPTTTPPTDPTTPPTDPTMPPSDPTAPPSDPSTPPSDPTAPPPGDTATPPADDSASSSGAATPEQVAQIVNQEFPTYDADTSGDLSETEFATWMTKLRTATDPTVDPQSEQVKTWNGQAFAAAD